MPDKQPLDFCLLVPCYNNISGLLRSLDSVQYSGPGYLIVIIDDGSAIPVDHDQLCREQRPPGSILILRNETNQGITFSLNKGLNWILSHTNARYIARLDCGDICRADRFDKQVQFMDAHPAIGIMGSWCRFQEPSGRSGFNYTTPVHHSQILRAMHFRNVFIHPTVMIRCDVLIKNKLLYPNNFLHAEDYAFFWTLLHNSQSYILNEYLVICEINKTGLSYKNRGKQLVTRMKVVQHFGKTGFLKILNYFCLSVLLLIPAPVLLLIKKSRNKKANATF